MTLLLGFFSGAGVRAYVAPVTGGAVAAGTATRSTRRAVAAVGGATGGGAANTSRSRSVVAAGGAVVGGLAATAPRTRYTAPILGGAGASGAAAFRRSVRITTSGAMLAGSAALVRCVFAIVASSGAVSGGSASVVHADARTVLLSVEQPVVAPQTITSTLAIQGVSGVVVDATLAGIAAAPVMATPGASGATIQNVTIAPSDTSTIVVEILQSPLTAPTMTAPISTPSLASPVVAEVLASPGVVLTASTPGASSTAVSGVDTTPTLSNY